MERTARDDHDRLKAVLALAAALTVTWSASHAASIQGVYPFIDTGPSTPSNYAKGNTPASELLQASDGNFYGTTIYGGSGTCPNTGTGGYLGCGTIFRINPTGAETVIYSFTYDSNSHTAPNGAFPTAGLIQDKDGYLYGVAQDGGISGCNGAYGCGTLFRVSTAGAFTLLHQFCGYPGCTQNNSSAEPGRVMNHLVQTADGTLYGVGSEGGSFNDGVLFSASTSGTVTNLHVFVYGAGDGDDPIGALLVGHDGRTLYGTTVFGGDHNGGTVFRYNSGTYTVLYSFDNATAGQPFGALIYGKNGQLYGTTSSGSAGGTLFSLTTTGSDFAIDASFLYSEPVTGLLLGSDGNMYGTLLISNVSGDGSTYSYNPTTKNMKSLIAFSTNTGAYPRGALIEGKDKYLYGTNSLYGGSNSRGTDAGTLYRMGPALPQ
jgi:uncharacterized repeat protein (TIGR03803 family)